MHNTRHQDGHARRPVEFDAKTGGLMVTHKEHNFDTNAMRKEYEQTVQRVGFKEGHNVILEIEDHTQLRVKKV